jgi:hypothetical protein
MDESSNSGLQSQRELSRKPEIALAVDQGRKEFKIGRFKINIQNEIESIIGEVFCNI